VELDIAINGVVLRPGDRATADELARAGLVRLSAWRHLLYRALRRLPAGGEYWLAADPHVVCFAGQVDIYACRDRYLDQDRRWGTELVLCARDGRIRWLDIRVLEGVYAAGNYYERFRDAVRERFGEPDRNGRRQTVWQRRPLQVAANLSADALDAVFHLEWHFDGSDAGMSAVGSPR
jgi:hypothetical protein